MRGRFAPNNSYLKFSDNSYLGDSHPNGSYLDDSDPDVSHTDISDPDVFGRFVTGPFAPPTVSYLDDSDPDVSHSDISDPDVFGRFGPGRFELDIWDPDVSLQGMYDPYDSPRMFRIQTFGLRMFRTWKFRIRTSAPRRFGSGWFAHGCFGTWHRQFAP